MDDQKTRYDSIQAPRPASASLLLPTAAVTTPLKSVTSCGHREENGAPSPAIISSSASSVGHVSFSCFQELTSEVYAIWLTLYTRKAHKSTLMKDWKYSISLKTSMQAMETGW